MFLWDKIAFGPIQSRRLGKSLGINVSPTTGKICSFNCIYCECGWTLEKDLLPDRFFSTKEIVRSIENKLAQCKEDQIQIDSITFSGNGEPTLHPNFHEIIDNLIVIRDSYFPDTPITCLSNASQLTHSNIFSALKKIENPILKLDAVSETLFQMINRSLTGDSAEKIVNNLRLMEGNFILQSMFLKGKNDEHYFNNASEPHLTMWLEVVKLLQPRKVMIYSLDRDTAAPGLEKIPPEELITISRKVQDMGVPAEAY